MRQPTWSSKYPHRMGPQANEMPLEAHKRAKAATRRRC